MDRLWQDVRYAVRMLLRQPGFTAVAVVTLALGIGANTAIFSVVNTVLFSPLPYPEPDRLLKVLQVSERPGKGAAPTLWSYPKFEALRDRTQSFEGVAAITERAFNLTGTDQPERL